jgi:hypothetical protein
MCSSSRRHGRLSRKGTKGVKSMLLTKECEKHLQELHEKNQDEDLIMKQHKLYFTTWFQDLTTIMLDMNNVL